MEKIIYLSLVFFWFFLIDVIIPFKNKIPFDKPPFPINRDEIDMEDEVHKQLIKIPGKTKSRSMAVGALSVLVDTDQISEFEALNKIDDWKQENYYS